jgi:hypothetical protein
LTVYKEFPAAKIPLHLGEEEGSSRQIQQADPQNRHLPGPLPSADICQTVGHLPNLAISPFLLASGSRATFLGGRTDHATYDVSWSAEAVVDNFPVWAEMDPLP